MEQHFLFFFLMEIIFLFFQMAEHSKLDVYENWFIWQDMDFIIIKLYSSSMTQYHSMEVEGNIIQMCSENVFN